MRQILLFFILVFGFSSQAQVVFIPDTNFKAYLVGNPLINTNGDTEIQVSEATSFSGSFNCDNIGISDLTGVEMFPNLLNIYASDNSIDTIDLSTNTNLIRVHILSSNVFSVTLPNSIYLQRVDLAGNNLVNLDLSACPNINYLRLSNNDFEDIDLSYSFNLVNLYLHRNDIDSLDLSNNTNLINLGCSSNNLDTLDLSHNDNLIYLFVNDNYIQKIDVSNLFQLKTLWVGYNLLTELDVSSNTFLDYINMGTNFVDSLDLSNNDSLRILSADNNLFTELDLQYNLNLEVLNVGNNQLTQLDVTSNSKLDILRVHLNDIPYLNLDNNMLLSQLDCSQTLIEELDLSDHTELVRFGIAACPELQYLDVANGNNVNYTFQTFYSNPNLFCITVDDSTYSAQNWTNISSWTKYNGNCNHCFTSYNTIDTNLAVNDSIINSVGDVWNITGTYYDTLVNACLGDSILEINLSFLDLDTTTLPSEYFCKGDTAMFLGNPIYQGGVYDSIFVNSGAPDSIVIQEFIEVIKDTLILPSESFCENALVLFYGDTITQSGIYVQSFSNFYQCDSFVIQEFIKLELDSTYLLQELFCSGELTIFYNDTITNSGIYVQPLVGSNQCDSFVIKEFIKLEVDTTFLAQETFCSGELVLFYGDTISQSGIYVQSFVGSNQCDSFVLKEFMKLESDTTILALEEFCSGDTVLFYGNMISTSGVHTENFANASLCDSLVSKEFIFLETDTTNLGDTIICYTDSVYFYNTLVIESGVYTHTLTSNAACDSVLVQNFEIVQDSLPIERINDFLLTDQGLDYYQWFQDSVPITAGNEYIQALQYSGTYYVVASVGDCLIYSDSIVVNDLQTGISLVDEWEISLYPNPANEYLNVSLNAQDYEVNIYDLNGKLVSKNVGALSVINLSDISKGLYFVQIVILDNDDHTFYNEKLIIK